MVGTELYRRFTDGELIELLINSQQSSEQLQAAWQEFIDRFEYLLIKTIRFAFRHLIPQKELTPKQICHLTEQIFSQLAQDNYKPLRELGYRVETRLETALQKLVYKTVLEYLNESRATKEMNSF
ncbi:MAG: hypothetical protein AB1489_21610 [Acidobacteriota bacterium]